MIFLKKKRFPTKMNFCYLFCEAFLHCLKTVQIRSFFWSAFSVFGHFSRSVTLLRLLRN